MTSLLLEINFTITSWILSSIFGWGSGQEKDIHGNQTVVDLRDLLEF